MYNLSSFELNQFISQIILYFTFFAFWPDYLGEGENLPYVNQPPKPKKLCKVSCFHINILSFNLFERIQHVFLFCFSITFFFLTLSHNRIAVAPVISFYVVQKVFFTYYYLS